MASARPSPIPLLVATVFVDIIGFGMILPLLPGTADQLGSSPTAIGVLVGAYSALQFLFAPLWGRLSDRIGRRPIILVGMAGSVLSYALFAVADSYPLLLLSRLLDGGSGATVNVAQAYLADLTAPAQRARAMGLVGAAVGMGFIVGPILGGITSAIDPSLPGWVAAAITLGNLLFAWWRLPESRGHVAADRATAARAERAPLGPLVAPVGTLFLATLAFSVMYVVFPLWGESRFAATRSTVSYWFAFVGLVTAIVQGGLLGRLVQRLGEPMTARAGTLILAGGFVLVIAAGRGTAMPGAPFWLALVLLGAGFGMAGPAMTGLVSRRTRQDAQGSILGVVQSASAMSRIIGPIVAGAVMELHSPETAFGASAAMALAACALAFGVARPDPADDGLSPGR